MRRTYPSLFLSLLMLTCGACNSTLDVGDDQRDGGPGGGPGPAPGAEGAKRLFVTKAAYTADLAVLGRGQPTPGSDPGAEGADTLCRAAAQAANLGGAWKAWISSCTMGSEGCTEIHNAIDRIADAPGGWYNVTRTARLFTNKGNLASYPLANGWTDGSREQPKSNVLDEYGDPIPTDRDESTQVWTGTGNGGRMAAGNCSGWTAPHTGATKGTIGLMTPDPTEWTNLTIQECHHPSHLYCLEQ